MGMFDELDRYATKTPTDDFEKPFFKTAAGLMVIAAALFVLLWFFLAVLLPKILG